MWLGSHDGPRETEKAQDAGKRPGRVTGRGAREGAGTGRERPVLVSGNGPRMDEDPEGPRHRVAGNPVGYKHGMRDGMGPHDGPRGWETHRTLGVGR